MAERIFLCVPIGCGVRSRRWPGPIKGTSSRLETSPDFSRCLVEGCGGLTSVVVEQGQSFGHGFLARCGELAGIIRRIMKLGCFPCGPGVQMAALSSAAHAVRKTSV